MLVNLGEDLWCHSIQSQSLDCASRSIGTRVGDGDDGKGDDSVEDVGQDLDAGKTAGADHWRVLGVGSGCTLEGWIIRWDDEAEEEQGEDVEDGDTPEHLLGGFWKGLSWVIGLSSGKTNKLCTSEGKSGGDEDGAPSLESVTESRPTSWDCLGWRISSWVSGERRVVCWRISPVQPSDVSRSGMRLATDLRDWESEN